MHERNAARTHVDVDELITPAEAAERLEISEADLAMLRTAHRAPLSYEITRRVIRYSRISVDTYPRELLTA